MVHLLTLEPRYDWRRALASTCELTVTASCASDILGRTVWSVPTQSCSNDTTGTARHCSLWDSSMTHLTVQVPKGGTAAIVSRCARSFGFHRILTTHWYRNGRRQVYSTHESASLGTFSHTVLVKCDGATTTTMLREWWSGLFRAKGRIKLQWIETGREMKKSGRGTVVPRRRH
jgi:hypothetical protein